MKYLLNLFLLTILMSYSFRISSWLTLNTVIMIFLIIVYIFKKIYYKNFQIIYIKEDLLYICFALVVLIGILINGINPKHITHTLSIIFVGVAYFYFLRNIIFDNKDNYRNIFIYLLLGLLLSNSIILFEYYVRNYNPSLLNIISIFQLGNAEIYNPTFMGKIYRARGFSIESGHTALAYNAITPIVCGYIWNFKKKYLLPFIIFTAASYLCLISAGGIGSILIGLIFTLFFWIFLNLKNILRNMRIIFFPLLMIPILLFLFLQQKQKTAISLMVDKILFKNDSGRFERWNVAFNEINKMDDLQLFFGWGVGHMSYLYNYDGVNLYLKLFTETGLLGLLFFLFILLFMFIRIIKITTNFKYFLMISFISVCAHYFVVSDYAYPWIWLVFAIIVLSCKSSFCKFYNIK